MHDILVRMERPAYLREDLYEQVIRELGELSLDVGQDLLRSYGYNIDKNPSRNDLLQAVLERPSRYLANTGTLERVDHLQGLFLEFDDGQLDDGHTYLIDREAAEEIVGHESVIMLRSGNEGVLVPRARLERAFRSGCVIDYSSRHSRPIEQK